MLLTSSRFFFDPQFEQSAEQVKNLNGSPENSELLELYGLYKQATVGDNNESAPWAVQVAAKAKYDAWMGNKGMSQDDAKAKYVKVAEALIAKYGLKA
jgi:diazepam-binding inhibitor (GABA receptor modulating acyl-CoA-binding protein)